MANPAAFGRRGALKSLVAGLGLLALAACDPVSTGTTRGTSGTVQVALLVPSSDPDANVGRTAQSIVNAARLAASELQGATVEIKVYDTAGSPATAAQVATQAVNDGADVILGPLYAAEANAVGNAVASRGVNVLAFSNNPAIAGGNVFVMGATFDNTARRMVGYAKDQGVQSILVVNGRSEAEIVGRDAIVRAIQAYGVRLAGTQDFELSQQGVTAAMPRIAASAEANGAQAIFLTSDTATALPFVVEALGDNNLSPAEYRYMGLTRWDIPTSAMALPGLQGGWFALPDTTAVNQFVSRYSATYGTQPFNTAIAGLGYDGIAAIGALAKAGKGVSHASLTQSSGFAGSSGAFRFLSDGTNQRALAVATLQNQSVRILEAAPTRFGSAGF
ncbi:penicillin-binding protein activator [Pseudoruegeria sp. SK021]|uniref:penicillin-binding protein activator n=1 Tax=Pseudoruegeria sp. SK021 TaxID=1933035 RepID=UPI000A225A78|nr:penicillin-binding protein activator [Pseudoruegeria sp. SK021]OSP56070.1 penicillin-binding protein activator [Pseudoruegeria sp. SK021]